MANDTYTDNVETGPERPGPTPTSAPTTRKLRRSRSDKMVAGVCGGLAKTFGIDPALLRILLVAATILGFGTGAVLYVICWIFMPQES